MYCSARLKMSWRFLAFLFLEASSCCFLADAHSSSRLRFFSSVSGTVGTAVSTSIFAISVVAAARQLQSDEQKGAIISTTSIFAPRWGRPRRPNPNPNINGYSLVTVSVDSDGSDEAWGGNAKDIDGSDEAWGGNSKDIDASDEVSGGNSKKCDLYLYLFISLYLNGGKEGVF